MKNSLFVFALVSAFTFSAVAGQEGGGSREGHGGDAVTCRDHQGQLLSAELYDYFEARVARGLTLSLPGDSYIAKVASALNRLEKVDPSYAKRLWGHFKRFLKPGSVAFPARADIPEIDDATILVSPSGNCVKIQLAVQYQESANQPLLLIDQEIWGKIGIEGRGGLFLHEIIYRDEIAFGATHSDGVRALTALLASDRFPALTKEEFAAFARANLLSHQAE